MNQHLSRRLANVLIHVSISNLIIAAFFGPLPEWNPLKNHGQFNNREYESPAEDIRVMRRSFLTPTIIGGEKAAKDAYPWTVALVKAGSGSLALRQYCAGTLIHPEWVLTAAHCTYNGANKRTPDSFNVLVGTTMLNNGTGREIGISEIVLHPSYNRSSATMDMALLHLAEAVVLPTIDIGDASLLSSGAKAGTTVLGWGKTQNKARSNDLLEVNVPLVDGETCRTAYATFGHNIDNTMICAGYAEGGKDACIGDSGGPLVAPILVNAAGEILEWALVGVVSWGKGCARANAYGVYADVAYAAEWIATHTSVTSAMTTNGVRGTANNDQVIFFPVFH